MGLLLNFKIEKKKYGSDCPAVLMGIETLKAEWIC